MCTTTQAQKDSGPRCSLTTVVLRGSATAGTGRESGMSTRLWIHIRGKRRILRPVPKGASHRSEVGLQSSFCDHSSNFENGDTRSPPYTSDQTCASTSMRDIPIPTLVQSGNTGTDTTAGEPVLFMCLRAQRD
jgi:hypothetical protein